MSLLGRSHGSKEGVPFYRAREIAKLASEGFVDNDLYISQDLYNEYSKFGVPSPGDLMITAVGTLGKSYIVRQNDKFYYKDASVICLENFANICPQYLKFIMQSEMMKNQIRSNSSGTTVATLTMIRMNQYLLPLPPLAEQHRIVQKIERILPHLDEYSEKESSLRQLNKNFPDSLKKSILQWAVQGKSVPQDPSDEPTSVLLERIRKEKVELIKEGKIKREKNPSFIYRGGDGVFYEKVGNEVNAISEEIPFDIPDSWEWVRLSSTIIENVGGGTPSKSNPNYWGGNIPWASVKDLPMNATKLDSTIDSITIAGLKNSSSNLISKGNIIICTRMGLGKIVISEIDVAINQDLRGIILANGINKDFFIHFYKTSAIKGQGLTVKGITVDMLNSLLMPIPPVEEQHRIVQKIEKLILSINSM
ncbi:MAG: hypothetical protein EOM67_02215 [Spirochaetia bacterium]|nr:hypothetical protein [Spirochaetia bacterium]